jgi:outer membrane protein TolC
MRKLLERHPDYLDVVTDFIRRDPLAAAGTLNRATAERLGLDSPAPAGYRELEAPAVSASRTLSLLDAVSEAMARNLDVRAGAAELRAGAARAERARAGLLPSLEARVEGRRIDEDRAAASNGRAPEYRTGGVLELRQVLYSEEARAEHRIERLLQQARVHQQEGVVLDAVLEAGTAYLDVLRTRARARIRHENLALTRSNLERARTRLELGVANRSELHRWEAELAGARAALARSEARAEGARLELNRVMDHPPGDRWLPLDPGLSDPWLRISDPRVLDFLDDPRKRPVLRDFLVREALEHAPALEQARQQVAARERSLTSARRDFTRPSVVAGAMVDKKFSQHGAGRDELDFDFADVFPGLPADGSTQIGGDVDNLEWAVGVTATLPLFRGGERFAAVDEERALLDHATLRADATRARIRTRVLSRAHTAEASRDAISWARDAARAARDNLELVTEAYDRGVVTVIDVLDAQTTALAAELDAAAARYDFLADYLALQRATGRFDLIADEGQRRAMRERLEAFAAGT